MKQAIFQITNNSSRARPYQKNNRYIQLYGETLYHNLTEQIIILLGNNNVGKTTLAQEIIKEEPEIIWLYRDSAPYNKKTNKIIIPENPYKGTITNTPENDKAITAGIIIEKNQTQRWSQWHEYSRRQLQEQAIKLYQVTRIEEDIEKTLNQIKKLELTFLK